MLLEKLTDKLPWRLQPYFNYRPKRTITKPLQSILKHTSDKMPFNAYTVVAKGHTYQLREPLDYLNDFKHPFFIENKVLEAEEVLFGSLKNGRFSLYNHIPTLINSNNEIVDAAQRHPFYYNPWEEEYLYPLLWCPKMKPAIKIKGNVLCLATDGAHNGYFHVIARMVAKLAVPEYLGIDLNEFSKIIVNGPEKPYKSSAFELLNIPKEKIIYANEGEHYQADYMFFVPRIRYHELGINFLRNHFIPKKNEGDNQRRIFLSREDAEFRKIVEKDDFNEVLARKQYEQVCFNGLSIKDQAKIINDSDSIIGIHGAGLGNLIFAEKGTTVIEILDDAFVNVNYWFYCNIIGLDYISVIGKSVKTPCSIERNRPGFDDISLSKQLMKKIEGAMSFLGQ